MGPHHDSFFAGDLERIGNLWPDVRSPHAFGDDAGDHLEGDEVVGEQRDGAVALGERKLHRLAVDGCLQPQLLHLVFQLNKQTNKQN